MTSSLEILDQSMLEICGGHLNKSCVRFESKRDTDLAACEHLTEQDSRCGVPEAKHSIGYSAACCE